MTNVPVAILKLNAWELLAMETALEKYQNAEQRSHAALLAKLRNAKPK